MFNKQTTDKQLTFFFSFEDTLDRSHPLFILATKIQWNIFEDSFGKLYDSNLGRPCKPIRLMVGLLILKHLRNLSDESVVEQWSENIYYQFFCGKEQFVPTVPCEASELTHFRKRIGQQGTELILKESIRINGKDAEESEVVVDTTVQEKNITYPTDSKLHRKIITKCKKIAQTQGLALRQSYTRTLKKLSVDQRFRNHPRNHKKARKADKKVKTIAGRLLRELDRKLPADHWSRNDLALYQKVVDQKKSDANKIYSLHEPEVQCIAKGKEHKKYEFGNKVSITSTKNTGVIVGAMSFRNPYDGHTLDSVLNQCESLTGVRATAAICDRGFKGCKQVGTTIIQIPDTCDRKKQSKYRKRKLRKDFRRRAAIEPVIGHLKSDHRLGRNFLKGIVGDEVNVLLASAAFNFKRMLNKWKHLSNIFVRNLIDNIQRLFFDYRSKVA